KSFLFAGGRGEDSSVIVTLPEYSAFSDIPEESLAKVLTYLTLIPRARQPGVKFIIILDRRLDTWTSIKTALARIAVSKLKSWHFSRVHTCTLVHVEMKSNVIGRIHSLSYLIVGGCEIPMLLALNNAVTRQTSTLNNNTF
uniref:CRAL-TRIO domain-containing protein n=1 Tax=Oncorhynchus mykiss TaxID=8022 RepID=A0A8C7Q894_ONCMY